MNRPSVTRVFAIGERLVTVQALEQVGPEDCYTMLIHAVMHRYVTAEDVVPTIGRDVKDALIKQNLVI